VAAESPTPQHVQTAPPQGVLTQSHRVAPTTALRAAVSADLGSEVFCPSAHSKSATSTPPHAKPQSSARNSAPRRRPCRPWTGCPQARCVSTTGTMSRCCIARKRYEACWHCWPSSPVLTAALSGSTSHRRHHSMALQHSWELTGLPELLALCVRAGKRCYAGWCCWPVAPANGSPVGEHIRHDGRPPHRSNET